MRFAKLLLIAALALLSVRTWADTVSVVSPVDAPGANRYTDAAGINNRGEIVGSFADAESRLQGYVFRKGTFDPLDSPESNTVPLGINDRGDVVGFGVENGSEIHGLQWDKGGGEPTEIDAPESGLTGAPPAGITFFHGINNRGQIVGHSRKDVHAPAQLFLWDAPEFSFFQIDGVLVVDRGRESLGINDRGQIVGTRQMGGINEGFLIDNGNITPIKIGVNGTYASGINNRGQIVGTYFDADNRERGYLRNANGSFTTIDAPNSTGISAVRLNEHGDIVGRFSESDGQFHGFLLTQASSLFGLNAPGTLRH